MTSGRAAGKDHRGIGGEEDLGVVNAHVLQLGKGVGVPESDHIHVELQNPGAQAAVGGIVDGADAAAVHQHPLPSFLAAEMVKR